MGGGYKPNRNIKHQCITAGAFWYSISAMKKAVIVPPLNPASYRPRPTWEVIFGSLVLFWIAWCVNALIVGFFGHLITDHEFSGTSSILAALATIGEFILGALVSIEDLLRRQYLTTKPIESMMEEK